MVVQSQNAQTERVDLRLRFPHMGARHARGCTSKFAELLEVAGGERILHLMERAKPRTIDAWRASFKTNHEAVEAVRQVWTYYCWAETLAGVTPGGVDELGAEFSVRREGQAWERLDIPRTWSYLGRSLDRWEYNDAYAAYVADGGVIGEADFMRVVHRGSGPGGLEDVCERERLFEWLYIDR